MPSPPAPTPPPKATCEAPSSCTSPLTTACSPCAHGTPDPTPPPCDQELPDPYDEHGRGLIIVRAISYQWGWTLAPNGGKYICFATLRTEAQPGGDQK